MNKKSLTILVVVLFIVGLLVFTYIGNQKNSKEINGSFPENINKEVKEETTDLLAGSETGAKVLEFSELAYAEANMTDDVIVLYFYANWCPICRAEFPAMLEVFNELGDAKVIGFRVNFNDNETSDAEEELAREFGVAYQHTKVLLKNGERVLKAPDSWDKEKYFSEINKYLSN